MPRTLAEIQSQMAINADTVTVDNSDAQTGSINIPLTKENDNFNPTQTQIQEAVKFLKRGHESGLINDTTQSSIVIRHNGQVNLSSSRYAQYKLSPNGKVIEESMESVNVTNRRKVSTDDMVLNEHKLNPYLYELTDIKKLATAYNDNMVVGNFCLFGSVLTLAWEMHLKRYVFLRRPARMPMFSPVLNIPEIDEGLGVTDPLRIDETLLAKSTKGYQVNAVVSDSKSLIGKDGQARWGNTNSNVSFGGDGSSASSSYKFMSGTPGITLGSPALKQWFLERAPYATDDIYNLLIHTAAKYGLPFERVLATCIQESKGDAGVVSPAGAVGLMQLMPSTAAGLGFDPYDVEQNVEAGCTYLKSMYEQFGDWSLAHAAYNAGPGAVQKAGNQIPNYGETTNYVYQINQYISELPADALNTQAQGSAGQTKKEEKKDTPSRT